MSVYHLKCAEFAGADTLNLRLPKVKTSHSNELLAQTWLMKSLLPDPGTKNNVMLYFELGCHKFYYLKLCPFQTFF